MLNILCICFSYFLSSLIYRWIINYKSRLIQPISDMLPGHNSKKGTPTMGGIGIFTPYILISLVVRNELLPIVLLAFFCGSLDDVSKVISNNNRGLSKSNKLLILGSGIFVYWAVLKGATLHQSALATIVMLAFIAAYGITDGLDGLLGSISTFVLTTLFALGYRSLHIQVLVASLISFLRYNLNPAKIFMGDCGSLALGALIGVMCVNSNYQPIFFVTSIVPFLNLLSVTIKITLAKLGIRYTLLAPIHHEFERRMGEINATKLLVLITGLVCLYSFCMKKF